MSLEVRGLDHQPIRAVALGRQFGEDPVGYAEPAPADEAVVDRLGWPVGGGRVAPAHTVAITNRMPCLVPAFGKIEEPDLGNRDSLASQALRFWACFKCRIYGGDDGCSGLIPGQAALIRSR